MSERTTAESENPVTAPLAPAWIQVQMSILEGLYDGVLLIGSDQRIVFWNRGAERITGFRASEVIGTRCCDVIQHHDYRGDPICPKGGCAVQAPEDPGAAVREAMVYVQHRQGRRVPVIARTANIPGPDGFQGVLEVFADNRLGMVTKRQLIELKRLALLDPLTELGNRRYGETVLALRLQERSDRGGDFGILLADLDHFKRVNDEHGHHAGDEVLRAVGRIFTSGLRAADTVARWGGEEFLFILSDLGRGDLMVVAEKLRAEVERAVIRWRSNALRITVSMGGCIVRDGDTRDGILERADARLYVSKRGGRNQITLFAPSEGSPDRVET